MKKLIFSLLILFLSCCPSTSESQSDNPPPISDGRFIVTRVPMVKGTALYDQSIFLIKDTQSGKEFLAAYNMQFIRID